MTTNEITITNFITNHINNYTEITNFGLNSETIQNLTKISYLDIIIPILAALISCIIPAIALITSYRINKELNKKNEEQAKEIYKINIYNILNIYFTKYIEYINSAYLNMLDRYSIHNQGEELINFIFEYLVNIESMIYSFKKLENNNYISRHKNSFKNLESICEYLKNIISFYKKEGKSIVKLNYEKVFNYLEYIKKYCDIIIVILYDAENDNENMISENNDIYSNIEKIHEEFDKLL